MRNGNVLILLMISVLNWFLPYLWGMETQSCFRKVMSVFVSSYRTYEEWKPESTDWHSHNVFGSSYRTYEEWKLADPGLSRINSNSSYRTYEEWKRGGATGAQAISVWFLPYLWGMETHTHKQQCHCQNIVLTVPMRNGNRKPIEKYCDNDESSYRTYEEWKRDFDLRFLFDSVRFLPYLWGMETWLW